MKKPSLWLFTATVLLLTGTAIHAADKFKVDIGNLFPNSAKSTKGVIVGDAGVGYRESQGDPIPGVDVTLEQNPGSVMKTVQTAADGSVSASGFAPNATVILAQGTVKKTLKADAAGKVYWAPSKPIHTDIKQPSASPTPAEASVTNTTRSNTRDNY